MAATFTSILLSILSYVFFTSLALAQVENQFIHHGFLGANLLKYGSTRMHPNGLLQLTNTSQRQMGQAFHGFPLSFNTTTPTNSSKSVSLSTSFVFAIVPGPDHPGHGLAFVISPSMDFSQALPSQYLGLFNISNNGFSSNRILAVEFDTVETPEFKDINDNHVAIDVNSLISIESSPAAYFDNQEMKNKSLKLASGDPIQVWIDYDGGELSLNVTIAPLGNPKPNLPLLSRRINLSSIFSENMYVGFSAATGTITSDQFLLGWSFSKEGKAQGFEISNLPSLPPPLVPSPPPSSSDHHKKSNKNLVVISAVSAGAVLILVIIFAVCFYSKKHLYLGGLQRFSPTTISKATGDFNEEALLGEGRTGSFYKGILPSKKRIAVKKVSCESSQRKKTLEAEIDTIGRLQHKNLVQLLGYCTRRTEMLLVYEYIPNGSLDRFLFSNDRPNLSWSERFKIIKGIASALFYLHEGCQRIILHKNVKASNVMLDEELNARLGDFGFQCNINTGYMAPELIETGLVTRDTDVFAFGVLMLEITCGRRVIEPGRTPEEISLINWVVRGCKRGNLLTKRDSRLNENFVAREIELVLKLGLLCLNQAPQARPGMKQVMQYLDGSQRLPVDERFFYSV